MAEMRVSRSEPAPPSIVPYAPSWFNHLSRRVDRLPIPYWLFYLALAAVSVSITLVIQWGTGASNPFSLLLLIFAVGIPYTLCGLHYLDQLAGETLQKFRPVLRASDAEYANLHYRLTTLPARAVWAAMAVGFLVAIIMITAVPNSIVVQLWGIADTPLSVDFLHLLFLINLPIAVLNQYHMLHQMRAVSRIYAHYTHIDLFNLNTLYAFSNLTARNALMYSFFTYSVFFASPDLISISVAQEWLLASILITALVFIMPLLGAHHRLMLEKEQLLLENSQDLKQATLELHGRISAGNFNGMGELHETLASLELERTALSRISTWPWHPEALRQVIGTLILPLAIWFIQWGLQQVLKP